jgi:CRISPR system Cascade subunit CasA
MILMTTDFNLTTEPWIPVTWRGGADGKPRIGLRETFERGHEIFDLSCRPHERVALLRLLQCVVQVALSGSSEPHQPSLASFKTWRALAANEYQPMRDAAVRYLGHHQPEFWLFDPKRPFLQLAGLQPASKAKERKTQRTEESPDEEGDEVNAEKRAELLDLCFARDNTSTLFDQNSGRQSDGNFRRLEPGQLALALLCYLNFAPGMPEGIASVNGAHILGVGAKPPKNGKCPGSDAPCLTADAIHTFALGESLAETIHLNLVPASELKRYGFTVAQAGKPVWEIPSDHLTRQNATANLISDEHLSPGFLEWLVPISRFAKLNENCREVVLTNGVGYSPYLRGADKKIEGIKARLPSTALEQVTKTDRTKNISVKKDVFVAGESGKALWRQLHVLAFLQDCDQARVPAWFRNVDELTSRDPNSKAWRPRLLAVAGVRADQAKFERFVESSFEFRADLLWRATAFNDYKAGVDYAVEFEERRLEKAVVAYANALARQVKEYAPVLRQAAQSAFWSRLDQDASRLLISLDQGKNDFAAADNPWGRIVRDAARMAFAQTCPSLSPQQLLAHAAGLAVLFPPPKKSRKK